MEQFVADDRDSSITLHARIFGCLGNALWRGSFCQSRDHWPLAIHIMPPQWEAPIQALAHSGAQRTVIARRHAAAYNFLAEALPAMDAKFM